MSGIVDGREVSQEEWLAHCRSAREKDEAAKKAKTAKKTAKKTKDKE